VTYRQQEAIERLAEASARVRLSNEVTKDDVDRALGLVRKSMEQVGIDPETGEFDADVVETGQSKSQRDRRNQLVAVIEEKGGTTADELTNVLDMDRDKVDADIQALKGQGMIYEMQQELRKA
jgi:replicative DNA helicase Mcm